MNFLDKLTGDATGVPQVVKGRHCQGDADIFAYECCDLDESVDKNIESLKLYIEQQRILSGSEMMNLHLTMGNKAGRYEIATVKEYQANRSNRCPLQQQRVWALRDFMATYTTDTVTPYPWDDREADDGMCQFQINRIRDLGENYSVIMTMDKDLRMVPGLHIHPKTLDAHTAPDGYGFCYLDESTSTKKVLGWGKSFFWHQMLMGDTADNIPGLPKLSGKLANKYVPTKTHNPNRRPIACGAVTAYKVLEGCTTEQEAFKRVLECYQEFYAEGELLTHWDGSQVDSTSGLRFYEQAQLLWMQREHGIDDVKNYFKEIFNG